MTARQNSQTSNATELHARLLFLPFHMQEVSSWRIICACLIWLWQGSAYTLQLSFFFTPWQAHQLSLCQRWPYVTTCGFSSTPKRNQWKTNLLAGFLSKDCTASHQNSAPNDTKMQNVPFAWKEYAWYLRYKIPKKSSWKPLAKMLIFMYV